MSEMTKFLAKDNEIQKHAAERLLKELNEKDKLFFIQHPLLDQ
jgi:predicted nucleic-acid-binding protein